MSIGTYFNHLLQSLRESGTISDKSFERIKAAERRRELDYRLINTSPLIAELDDIVLNMTLWNTENDI